MAAVAAKGAKRLENSMPVILDLICLTVLISISANDFETCLRMAHRDIISRRRRIINVKKIDIAAYASHLIATLLVHAAFVFINRIARARHAEAQ